MALPQDTQAGIQATLDKITSTKDGIPGVVFRAVNAKGDVLFHGASGLRKLGEAQQMMKDDVFWLASLTKYVTGIACLQLVEQGKVALDDPVEPLLPELSKLEIIEKDGRRRLNTTPITLRMLLNHTAGFSYTFFNDHIAKWGVENGVDEFQGRIEGVMQPLIAEPGKDWHYGVGVDFAGLLVERVSSMTLAEYFQENIFGPLGVTDMTFELGKRPDLQARLAGLHQRSPDGTLRARGHLPVAKHTKFYSGGGGLFGTAAAYTTLLTVAINSGRGANGAQILRPETIREAFTDQVAHLRKEFEQPLPASRPELVNPGDRLPSWGEKERGWGLTFLITHDPIFTGRSAGSAWWAGIANLFWWADPVTGIAGVIMAQILPFGDAAVFKTWIDVETQLYSGLKEMAQKQRL